MAWFLGLLLTDLSTESVNNIQNMNMKLHKLFIFAMLGFIALCSVAPTTAYARQERSQAAKDDFKYSHPCPSNGNNHGPFVKASLLITSRHWHVVAMTHQAICNGNRSQKGRQKINGSVRVAKSEAQWIIRILEKALIPVVAQALHHPTTSTTADQEAVALPIP
jgi:hypothetical protein